MKNGILILSLFLGAACSSSPKKTISKSESVNSSKPVKGLDAELSTYPYPFPVKNFIFKSQEQDLKMAYMDIPAGRPSDKVIVLAAWKKFFRRLF